MRSRVGPDAPQSRPPRCAEGRGPSSLPARAVQTEASNEVEGASWGLRFPTQQRDHRESPPPPRPAWAPAAAGSGLRRLDSGLSSALTSPAGSYPSPPETGRPTAAVPAGAAALAQGRSANRRRPAETGRAPALRPPPCTLRRGPARRNLCPRAGREVSTQEAPLHRENRLSCCPRRLARTRAPAGAPRPPPTTAHTREELRGRARPTRPAPTRAAQATSRRPWSPCPPPAPASVSPPAKRGHLPPRPWADRNPNRRSAPASLQGLRRPGHSGRRSLPGARLGPQILPGTTIPRGPGDLPRPRRPPRVPSSTAGAARADGGLRSRLRRRRAGVPSAGHSRLSAEAVRGPGTPAPSSGPGPAPARAGPDAHPPRSRSRRPAAPAPAPRAAEPPCHPRPCRPRRQPPPAAL